MATTSPSPAHARFDRFHVDFNSGKLLRSGVRVPIQEQPFQVLRLLLEAEGRVVTREQLRCALWPQDTFVDFEHSVNTAVKKLRQALEDSADRPKFVETLPRFGYRFMVPVEWGNQSASRGAVSVMPTPLPGPIPVPQSISVDTEDATKARPRRVLGALVVGMLLLAGVSAYQLRDRSRSQTKLEPLTIAPFTTFPGFEIAPSFSPDGNQIVFSWFGYEKEFQFDLYVKQVGQEHVLQLTHHPAVFLASAWSPDGRFIAFMRQADPDATGIFLISPLGGAERKVADITSFGSWEPIGLSWSADGKWVAFPKMDVPVANATSTLPHFTIHQVNVETTEVRNVPEPSPDCGNVWAPAFSPDGKYLASVCVLTEGVAKIYVQTHDGKQPREVVSTWSAEGFSGIAWAADSASLVYSSDLNFWRVPLAGGKPEKLLFAQDVESVSVARTGNRLAFGQVHHPSSIWRVELASPTKTAGPATKVISSSRGDREPHLSPDGKSIAFQSRRSGSPEIWVCARDGSNPVQLSSFAGPQVGAPSWSPDSRRIVFDLHSSGNAQLYIVNVGGGPQKRFDTGTANASSPFWSTDGHWIYFSTERPDSIWKMPVDGGVAIRLAEGKGKTWPQESADGSRVFFYKFEGDHSQILSMSVDGGDERPVTGMPPDVAGVPSRDGFYFVGGSPRHFSLQHFDFITQRVRKVSDLPGLFALWSPHLSPDGRSFFFSGIEHSEGDIMLVDNFR